MKIFLYLFIFLFTISCASKNENKVIITGTIENPTSDFIELSAYEQFEDTAFLDEENSFSIEISIDKPVHYVALVHGDEYAQMYLEPGFKLSIKFNTENFDESLTFEGAGSDENRYTMRQVQYDLKVNFSEYELYLLEPDDFKAKLDDYFRNKKRIWEECSAENDGIFWEHKAIALYYAKAKILDLYPGAHKQFKMKDSLQLADNYYDYLEEIDVTRHEYLTIIEYVDFVRNYVRGKTNDIYGEQLLADTTFRYSLANLKTVLEVIEDEKIQNHILTIELQSLIPSTPIDEIGEEIEFYFANCTDDEMKSGMRELVSQFEKLAKRQPAPIFSGLDLEGNVISLTDFLGKYVYVDVWAAWCGPCKYEIPHLKELESDYHDKNIVFISYSVDKDKEAWRKMVVEDTLQGIQIIEDETQEFKLSTEYVIQFIPTFILIDREGRIISRDAPRPSGKIREMLDELEGI